MPKAPQQQPKPAWTPKDQREAEARAAGLPYVAIDGQMYQDQENQQDQAAEQAEQAGPDPAPPSAPPAEVRKAADAQAPDRNYDLVDSLGNPKMEQAMKDDGSVDSQRLVPVEKTGTAGQIGPRGKDAPPDALSSDERQKRQLDAEKRLAKGMPSTANVDSIGNLKGNFADPDKRSEKNRLEEREQFVGPRGQGAPTDTYHGPRPVKKS